VLLEPLILGVALPELVVGSLVLDALSNIVSAERFVREFSQLEPLTDDPRTLPQAHVAHLLQCLLADQPPCLLLIQHLGYSLALDLVDHEPSLPPPSDDVVLSIQLDARLFEDIRRPQPRMSIRAEGAKPEEDDKGLGRD